jgi:hypothetical protein
VSHIEQTRLQIVRPQIAIAGRDMGVLRTGAPESPEAIWAITIPHSLLVSVRILGR